MKLFKLFFVTVMLVSLSGCWKKFGTVEDEMVNTSQHPRARLIMGAEELEGRVVIGDPVVEKVGNNLEASVRVQNRVDASHRLEYKFSWRDQDGMNLSSESWKRMRLSQKEIRRVSSTSNNDEAYQFTFILRPVNSGKER